MKSEAWDELFTVYLTAELAARTAELLDSFATHRPSEGVVYWFGLERRDMAVVTTLIVPAAKTSSGSVLTSVQANASAISVIVGTPLVLLGQAHSHPGWNVGHSRVDDDDTYGRFDGAISVVVPWFGRYGLRLEDCGVYRHAKGRFRAVQDKDRHLKILPGFADLRCTADREAPGGL